MLGFRRHSVAANPVSEYVSGVLVTPSAPRHQSTVKTLKLEEVQDYDRFFCIQRIVSPSPMESFIRSVLISQIVNWNNASERYEAALKLGFQEQIALIERVLASPEETV